MNTRLQKFTSYAAFAISLFTLIVLLATSLGSKPWEVVNAIAALISGLAASLGLLFVGLQLRSTDRLTKAQFINVLAEGIDSHSEAETNLDPGGKWYESDTPLDQKDMEILEKYLNFFERVKFIFDTEVIDIETVDELFAYRFFHLVHNPNVRQQIILHPDIQPYYSSIFKLYYVWLEYRKNKRMPIPRDEFTIIAVSVPVRDKQNG
jgi:hypothetical protein